MKILQKILSRFWDTILFLLLIGTALIVSYLAFIWSGYPVGGDVPQHLYRALVVQKFFPNHLWLHTWAGGMPHFIWYPSLPYFLVWLIGVVSKLDPSVSLIFTAVLGYGIFAGCLYLVIRRITGSWGAGLLSSLIFLTSISVWQVLHSAIVSRVITHAFWGISLLFFVNYLIKPKKLYYFFSVVFLGLTLLSHPVMGLFASGTLFIISIFVLGFKRGLQFSLKQILPAFLIASTLLIPSVLRGGGFKVGQEFIGETVVAIFSDLFHWHVPKPGSWAPMGTYYLSYPVLIVPLVLSFLCLIFSRKFLMKKKMWLKMILALLFLTLITVVYAMVYIRTRWMLIFYNEIITTLLALTLTPVFAGLASGILWVSLWRKSWLASILSIPLILGLSYIFILQFPLDVEPVPYKRIEERKDYVHLVEILNEVTDSRYQFNYRVGTGNHAYISAWINDLFPYIPQNRDFYFRDVANPDMYFYLMQAVWVWSDNYKETDFLLDWWGIKQFVIELEDEIYSKYADNPNYEDLGKYSLFDTGKPDIKFLKNPKATPVLLSTNTPSVLVISDKDASFTTFFKSLAYANVNSQKLIPVRGESYFVDSYSLDELSKFPGVVLYEGYSYKNKSKANALLSSYVESGGFLFIESRRNRDVVKKDLDVTPVNEEQVVEVDNWNFDSGENVLAEEIDVSMFAPPRYDKGPWLVSKAKSLVSGAVPILYESNSPVLVFQKKGAGKIIWSGINLFFHAVHHTSEYESDLIGKLFLYSLGRSQFEEKNYPPGTSLTYETDEFKAQFVNPHKRIVTLKKPASGVLLKEFYFPNWRVEVDGKKAKLYYAGSGFMYVPLKEAKAQDEIVFSFGRNVKQWISDSISLIVFMGLILYVFDWWIFKPYVKNLTLKLHAIPTKISGWWEKDEEE